MKAPTASTTGMNRAARGSAALLLVGQLLYIVVTQFHTGGQANDHHAIFAAYAGSGIWTAVHLGQFVAMTLFLAGLFALSFVLDTEQGIARWTGRCGAALAAVTLALYGVLQAVDGVALKQAVNAWASAPEAEKAARFASAEVIRWLEWGVRSYHNFALGLTLFLFAAALMQTAWVRRPVPGIMALSGLACMAQGWATASAGFTQAHTIAILLSWALNLTWIVWLGFATLQARGVEGLACN